MFAVPPSQAVIALSMPESAASVTRSQITCGSGVAASTAGGNDSSATPASNALAKIRAGIGAKFLSGMS